MQSFSFSLIGHFENDNEYLLSFYPSGSTCKDDEESVAYQWDRTGWGTTFKHGNHYCCPKSEPIPLKNCHWVGKGDCADNTCNAEEVTLATDNMGDAFTGCSCEFPICLVF